MKDIPVDELAAISPEIHEAAQRVGCTQVSITGCIWPGGQLSGAPAEAARFVEFSWLRAAAVGGRAVFEDAEPEAYTALERIYGLAETSADENAGAGQPSEQREPKVAALPETVELTVAVLRATQREMERQAAAAGLTVGEWLDRRFAP